MKRGFGILLIVLILTMGVLAQTPRVVFYFIGDGMGFPVVEATRIYLDQPMIWDDFPVQGQITTHSANAAVTDSAAAGTALATGYKTNNMMVSISPELEILVSIIEAARDAGWRTGIMSDTAITHATPAVFGSHVMDRNEGPEIGRQMLAGGFDLLFGGGRNHFPGSTLPGAVHDGWDLVFTLEGMQAIQSKRLLGIFATGEMNYVIDRPKGEPSLYEMMAKAIEVLDQDNKPFIIMVEGGRIDHAGHANDALRILTQTIEFDQAIRVAYEWAQGRDDVLIVVTADHETGGVRLTGRQEPKSTGVLRFTSTDHTGDPVPLAVWGAGAELFTDVTDNTHVPRTMARAMGLTNFPRKYSLYDWEVTYAAVFAKDSLNAQLINGQNRARSNDELIRYTPEHGANSGTNQWGIELAIVDGVVTAVRPNGVANQIGIPRDGYVISGHGEARRILEGYQVGDRIRILGESDDMLWRGEPTDWLTITGAEAAKLREIAQIIVAGLNDGLASTPFGIRLDEEYPHLADLRAEIIRNYIKAQGFVNQGRAEKAWEVAFQD